MVHVELLCHRWSLAMPSSYQNECAIFKSSFCTCVQELRPFAGQVHAGSSVPHPSYSPCVKNSVEEHPLFWVCTIGCGGHRKGRREKDLPATRDRKVIGLMSLSSNCARSADLTCDKYCLRLIIVLSRIFQPQALGKPVSIGKMGVEKKVSVSREGNKKSHQFFWGVGRKGKFSCLFFFFNLAPQQALFECLCLGEGQKLNDFGQLIFWDQVFWWL